MPDRGAIWLGLQRAKKKKGGRGRPLKFRLSLSACVGLCRADAAEPRWKARLFADKHRRNHQTEQQRNHEAHVLHNGLDQVERDHEW